MRYLIILVLFALAVAVYLFIQQTVSDNEAVTYRDVVVRYSISLRNNSAHAVNNAAVDIFIPENSASQQLQVLKATFPFLQQDGKALNTAHFLLEQVAPYSENIITLTAQLALRDSPVIEKLPHKYTYLADGDLLQLTNPALQTLKQKLAEDNGYVDAVYQWLITHMKYAGYIQEDRGAAYALSTRTGDCTEYMYLLMALLRANGIPARGMAGFYLHSAGSQLLKAKDYHNWVEYYDGKAWRILDPLNNNKDSGYGRYVVLRKVSVNKDHTGLSSQRFVSHDARLAISMK